LQTRLISVLCTTTNKKQQQQQQFDHLLALPHFRESPKPRLLQNMSAQSKDRPKITVYAKDKRLTTTSCLKAHEQINLMITDLYNLTYLLQINFCIDSVAIEMHKFFGVGEDFNCQCEGGCSLCCNAK